MVLLASMEPTASVLGTPPADLLLRIVGTARDGQVVRLSNRKCSIGSGPNCTLRLRARGVRPVHCLLLRGPGGTVLRSWAPGIRVNGEIVSDAVLEAGDLITIGPIEFEVLPSEGPPVDPFDAGRTVVLDRRPAGSQPSNLSATTRLIAPLAPRPFEAQSQPVQPQTAKRPRHWRSRVRKLVGEVRKLRDQIDRFEQAAPIAEQQAAEAAQLRERLDSVKEQNQSWESTLQRLQAELDGRQSQLATELTSLDFRRTELETERQAWHEEHEAQRRALSQREAAHADALLAHQQVRETWTRDTASREAELTAAAEALNLRQAELTQLAASSDELAKRQSELDRRAAELDARETELAAAEVAVRQAEEELAGQRVALESQRLATNHELTAAHQELQASQAEFAAARERIATENEVLAASREELESHSSRLADYEAELVAARQAIAALHESEEERLGERTAELERLAAELSARELELAERLHAPPSSTDTVVAEPSDDLQAELQLLRQELVTRTEELAQAQAAIQRANELALQQSISRETAEQEFAQALAARQNEFDDQQAAQRQQLAQREAELAARESAQASLAEQHQKAVEQHQQALAQHEQTLVQLEQSQIELHARTAVLAQREAALAEQPHHGEAPREPDPAQVAALAAQREAVLAAEAELQREREELHAEREALRQERESFAHERLRAADRLDADARELAEARDQLDAEREELESRARRTPLRSPSPAFEDRGEQESAFSEFSPDRRSGRSMFPSEAETERAPSAETLRSRPPSEDDDSMESHIAAFMDRLRGGQPTTPPVVERTLPKRRKCDEQPAPPAESAEPVGVVPSMQVVDVATAPMEIARRKAPEEKTSMNVLREIGLSHARSAIDTHGQRRSLDQAYVTLAISAACLAVAFLVVFMAGNAVMRSAGVAILIIGIYWMGSSIWAANKVVATIRRRRKGGLRAMLEEVDAEIAAIRKEAEAEIAAAEQERAGESAAAE